MHHRSRASQAMVPALIFGIALLAGLPAAAQTTPAQAQTTPSLTVDSDPVPSPDSGEGGRHSPPVQDSKAVGKEDGRYTLHAGAYEVLLNVSVLDSDGRAVGTLSKDAFKVYEDGVPQNILEFRHEDVPVSIGILIDASGSMYDKRPAVDKASIDLVKLSNPQDEAFLVDFSSEAYIDQDFTSDIAKLQKGLGFVKASGGTALYDAVVASADYLSKNAKRTKQVLLVVTDGADNASSASLEQAIRRVQDLDGPTIYTIGLLFGEDTDRSESRRARSVLQELSEQTGGEAFFPKSLKEVDGIAQTVAEDIRTQYTVQYRSTKSPDLGGYRQIHVEAKEKGYRGLQARTRAGYFPKLNRSTEPPAAEPPIK